MPVRGTLFARFQKRPAHRIHLFDSAEHTARPKRRGAMSFQGCYTQLYLPRHAGRR
jgi:hypothetical protein